ncbi:MAG TPA: serpin family protein, partial [Roseiflexaceae bacterium]|nr:serpin family protein [Roseiflexaceae bacterium]
KGSTMMAENAPVAANIHFAFKLFAELTRSNIESNVFVSPVSVALALAMAYNGARGETQRAIARTLELGEISLDELNRANAGLIESLRALDPQIALAIANSLWARQGLTFEPDYLRRSRDFYHAEIATLDFGDPRAAQAINDWVARNTNGKIEKIVDRIDRTAIMFLINAIYFKGHWARQFDARRTRELPFTLPDGRRKQHPLMAQSGKFDYYAGQGFQAINLPYGAGRASMYIFLPEQRSSLRAFRRELSHESWDTWMRHFRQSEGTIVLPRFKLSYEVTLNDALKALGMAIAFDGQRADFSAMLADGKPSANIDEVKHKTFVELNEEGTEAAAVTSIGMVRTSMMPQRSFSMVVDRPFFCAIRDNQTGALLFMGSIVEPE